MAAIGSSRGLTSVGPFGQFLQRAEGIGQVGLQHDASVEMAPFWGAKNIHERLEGEVEVVVFLHVEVHEGRWLHLGGPVDEQTEPFADSTETVVVGPVIQLGGHSGDLDRHVIDVRLFEQPE